MNFGPLNPNSPKPLYSQVKDTILDYIEQNNLQPNDRIPSERELAEILGVSRLTVRKALEMLIQDGVAYQQAGRGSFLSTPKLQQRLLTLTSFTEAITQEGHTPGTQLLEFGLREVKTSIARRMGIEPGTPALVIRRLRFVDQMPFSIASSYLLSQYAGELTEADLAGRSLYGLLDQRCAVRLAHTQAFLDAVSAEHLEATLLSIKPGAPLFRMSGTAHDQHGQLLEYFEVLYRGDRLRFSTESSASSREAASA